MNRVARAGTATSLFLPEIDVIFNTWVYGRNPMPRRTEVPRRERLLLTLSRKIEGQPANVKPLTVASAEPASSPA